MTAKTICGWVKYRECGELLNWLEISSKAERGC